MEKIMVWVPYLLQYFDKDRHVKKWISGGHRQSGGS